MATRTGQYTICTAGSLDTIGTLYDCNGNQIIRVDDYAPCGKINFRIIQNLVAGNTYYVKVRIYGNDTGNYTLRVTERVFANYVTINKSTIALEQGVTYELPVTPNYTYKGYNGAQRISESELFFGAHSIYDLTFGLQCFSVVLQILALPVAFSGLAGISVPAGYTAFLKYANLSYTLTKAVIEEDYKTYIESLINEATGDEDNVEDTKSAGTNLDWAMALFKLSDSFEELSAILASRPNYYKEIFEHCAEDNNYRIFFEYNNGTLEETSSISNRLN